MWLRSVDGSRSDHRVGAGPASPMSNWQGSWGRRGPAIAVVHKRGARLRIPVRNIARVTHRDLVGSVALDSDGDRLVLASAASASFSCDGQRILLTAFERAVIFDSQTGKEIARVTHDGYVVSGAFSRDGQRIVTASLDKTARISDAQTGKEIARVTLDDDAVSAGFSPDGRRIVTASWDKAVRISDAHTGKEIVRGPRRRDFGRLHSVATGSAS